MIFNKPPKSLCLVLVLVLTVILSSTVLGLDYLNETVKTDITSLEWCFAEDWTDKELYKDNWELYVDNLGCDITSHNIYAVTPVKFTQTDYWNETTCLMKENKSAEKLNGTYPVYPECVVSERSKTYDTIIYEKYDLEKTDYLFPKGSKICVEATRDVSKGFGVCDMNFRFDSDNDGVKETDVKSDGKLWWNTTWAVKYQINSTAVATEPTRMYKLLFNDSYIQMSDCQADGGDVRFLNSDENETIAFNLSSWNSSEGTVYINQSIKTNQSIYLYCNASTSQNTTSVALDIELDYTTGTPSYVATGYTQAWSINNLNDGDFTYDADGAIGYYINTGTSNTFEAFINFTDNWRFYRVGFEDMQDSTGASNAWNWSVRVNGSNVSSDTYDIDPTVLDYNDTISVTSGDYVSLLWYEWNNWARAYIAEFFVYGYGYAEPVYSTSSRQLQVTSTALYIGVFNSTGQNTTTLNEDEGFYVYANYSFLNGSSVHPNGWCNYSADNILEEYINSSVGSNTSICTVGCDTTNYTIAFNGLTTETYNHDYYRLRLCHNGNPVGRTFTIANNNSGVYTYPYSVIRDCDLGYTNFSLLDGNSSGKDIELSVWSNGVAVTSLVLVDNWLEIDRDINDTADNMTWNGSIFLSDLHEYHEHGSYNIFVDCQANITDIENKTGQNVTLLVENVPPVIFIDDIWDWFAGLQTFTNGVTAYYPLQSTVNISGACLDDDLFNAYVNLSYANGTLIYSNTFMDGTGIIPTSVNFTQGNFSTNVSYLNGDLAYTMGAYCNDSTANITHLTRTFKAINNIPTISWTNTTPLLVGQSTFDLNWSCSDTEGETTTSYLFINNTNMSAPNQTGGSGYDFGLSANTYNFSVMCADSFRNSTMSTILVTYTPQCVLVVGGLTANERYRTENVTINASCSNGINLTSCSVEINDYAPETFNCTSDTITLEVGDNKLNISVIDVGTFQTDQEVRVFAKKRNSTIADYMLLFVLVGLSVALLWFANSKYDAPIGHFFVVGSIGLTGYFLISLSIWVSAFVWSIALFYALYQMWR